MKELTKGQIERCAKCYVADSDLIKSRDMQDWYELGYKRAVDDARELECLMEDILVGGVKSIKKLTLDEAREKLSALYLHARISRKVWSLGLARDYA